MSTLGEEQLKEYRKQVQEKMKEISLERDTIIKGYNSFKLQLITLAGGTISVFVALQGKNNINLLVKIGFAGLGISLLLGVISIFFHLAGNEQSLALQEEFNLFGRKSQLDLIRQFGKVDTKTEEQMHEMYEKTNKAEKERLEKRYGMLKKLMKFFHVDAQKIEDGQLLFFLLGILTILVGLFV